MEVPFAGQNYSGQSRISSSSIYWSPNKEQFQTFPSLWISQFTVESTELKNGALTATNSKPESIEQDGPSEVFRDEEDSKVG